MKKVLLTALAAILLALALSASRNTLPPITLAWDACPDPDVYILYCNGLPVQYVLPEPEPTTVFFPAVSGWMNFTVTQIERGIESAPSNTVRVLLSRQKSRWIYTEFNP